MAKGFNRKQFMQELHEKAKLRRDLYREIYPNRSVPKYSTFLSNQNPIDSNIIIYEVTFQLDYKSAENVFQMSQAESFLVYSFASPEASNKIYESTKSAILDMKGRTTGSGLNLGTQKFFEQNEQYLNIKLNESRGMEKIYDKKFIDSATYQGLKGGGLAVEGLDPVIQLKNKEKGGQTFNSQLDLNHFN